MRIDLESRWVRLYGARKLWGVKIVSGMRLRDMPQDIRTAATPHEGALEPLRFRADVFYYVEWLPADGWPVAKETALNVGDYIVELPDYGLSYIRGMNDG